MVEVSLWWLTKLWNTGQIFDSQPEFFHNEVDGEIDERDSGVVDRGVRLEECGVLNRIWAIEEVLSVHI